MKKRILLTGFVTICLIAVINPAQAQYFKFEPLTPQQVSAGVSFEKEIKAVLNLFSSLSGSGH